MTGTQLPQLPLSSQGSTENTDQNWGGRHSTDRRKNKGGIPKNGRKQGKMWNWGFNDSEAI